MKCVAIGNRRMWAMGVVTLALVVVAAAGCKSRQAAPPTDQQIATDVQVKIQGESALSGQNIQVSVQNGVATLNGTVSDEASRALAANDSATIAGIKTVVNNLTVQSAKRTPASAEPVAMARSVPDKPSRSDRKQQQQASPAPPAQDTQTASNPQPPSVSAPPPPPPAPIARQLTLPAGTVVPIRITETLDSKTTQSNDAFHGSVAGDIGLQGVIAIPRGTPVTGRIIEAREAAHFKGASLLSIELTQLQINGQNITLVTDSFVKEGTARGKNTAVKAGGGAALGAIIGAIAGGGKGAAIGTLAGGAAGVGVNAATRGQQTIIPTETLINFQLQSPITVTVPPGGADQAQDMQDPQLQQR